MIFIPLWILRGGKVKNCHQISHWFQLVLPSTKQPLSVCDHRLVLIHRLVPLHLIATGPLSVLQPDYSPPTGALHSQLGYELHHRWSGGFLRMESSVCLADIYLCTFSRVSKLWCITPGIKIGWWVVQVPEMKDKKNTEIMCLAKQQICFAVNMETGEIFQTLHR